MSTLAGFSVLMERICESSCQEGRKMDLPTCTEPTDLSSETERRNYLFDPKLFLSASEQCLGCIRSVVGGRGHQQAETMVSIGSILEMACFVFVDGAGGSRFGASG